MNDLAFAYHPPRPPKYHITAINPLTRLREPVTLPCSKEKAEKMLAKLKKKPPRQAYMDLSETGDLPPPNSNV